MVNRNVTAHDIIDLINRTKKQPKPELATVVEVSDKGVKIKIDGQEAVPIYYNSLCQVTEGDRVLIHYCSGTIIIIGKLEY